MHNRLNFALAKTATEIMPMNHVCMRCGKNHGMRASLYCFYCSCFMICFEKSIQERADFYEEAESHYTTRGYW